MKHTNEDGENASSYTTNSSRALFVALHQSSSVFFPPYYQVQHLFPLHFASRLNSAFLVISPGSPIPPHQARHPFQISPLSQGYNGRWQLQLWQPKPQLQPLLWSSKLTPQLSESRVAQLLNPPPAHSTAGQQAKSECLHLNTMLDCVESRTWLTGNPEPHEVMKQAACSLLQSSKVTRIWRTLQHPKLIDPYKWFFPVDASILSFDSKTSPQLARWNHIYLIRLRQKQQSIAGSYKSLQDPHVKHYCKQRCSLTQAKNPKLMTKGRLLPYSSIPRRHWEHSSSGTRTLKNWHITSLSQVLLIQTFPTTSQPLGIPLGTLTTNCLQFLIYSKEGDY